MLNKTVSFFLRRLQLIKWKAILTAYNKHYSYNKRNSNKLNLHYSYNKRNSNKLNLHYSYNKRNSNKLNLHYSYNKRNSNKLKLLYLPFNTVGLESCIAFG